MSRSLWSPGATQTGAAWGIYYKVRRILECVCFYCSRIKVDQEALRFSHPQTLRDARSRLNQVWNVAKSKMICEVIDPEGMGGGTKSGCGHRQPIIRREGLRLYTTFKSRTRIPNRGKRARAICRGKRSLTILRRISDADCIAMGLDPKYARPDWLVLTALPVPPPARGPVHPDGWHDEERG